MTAHGRAAPAAYYPGVTGRRLLGVTLAAACVSGAVACSSNYSAGALPVSSSSSTTSQTTLPATTNPRDYDWRTFDFNRSRTGVEPNPTGLTAANLPHLQRQVISLPGTPDSSPVYLHAVTVEGAVRNVFFLTTTYGRTVAVAAGGKTLWTYTPSSYAGYAGTYQITTASPVIDPSRAYVYATTPDGFVHKLSVASGHEVNGHGWPVKVTRLPGREKLPASLNVSDGRLYVTTGGYVGDIPPYQGHVVVISLATGAVLGIWNSLCSGTHQLLSPPRCPQSDSAIFGRSGAVIDPANGQFLVATGNAFWNGHIYWGDSVIQVSPTGSALTHTFTPTDQATLNTTDTDVGSTSPAILSTSGPVIIQGGKDGFLRVIDMGRQGVGKLGGAVQTLRTPGADQLFTTPAVWHAPWGREYVFVADPSGTAAFTVTGSGTATRLSPAWSNGIAGTSPLIAGGLLYIYDPTGALKVYGPGTGHVLASLPASAGHWNSPIVADGMIALPEGDANDHLKTGQFSLYHP